MATSKLSCAQVQVKLACDQCETLQSVNSYCRDCSANLCDRCEKGHVRLYKKHTIVPVFVGLFEKIHFRVNCEQHDEKYKFFCKSCSVNVCVECSTAEHTGHTLEKIDKHAKILKQNIIEKVQSKKTEVEKIQAPLSSINKHIENFEKHTQSQIDNVRSEIVRKKELLDTEGETIIESLKYEQKIALETLKTQYSQLKDLNDKLNALIESMEDKLTRIPDEAVFNFVTENENELKTNTSNMTFDLPSPSVFTPSSYMYDERSGVLGSLERVSPTYLNITFDPHPGILLGATQSTPTDPPSNVSIAQIVKPKVIMDPSLRRELYISNRFRPTDYGVVSISATDDMLWVGTLDRKLVLVKKTGKQKLKVKMPGLPYHTAVTRAGDALVSTEQRVIYKVSRKGKVSTFVDVSPGKVWGITATQDGDVFACVDTYSGFKVKKFSSEGKFVLELDSAIFIPGNCLYYVHAVRDDVVCVQDSELYFDAECQLVFVTAAGQLISRVTRTGKLQEYTGAIVWDDHGNMLTGTLEGDYNQYMHVFSREGACKHSYKVEGALGRITTLCLGKDGAVWIGTSRGEVITATYLQ